MKRTAVNNTLILTITNVINRSVGFAFRIVLIRIAGREAVGLWQMVSPLYLFFLVLASAGLSTAISRLVAEHRAKGDVIGMQRLLRTALCFALICGLTAAILLMLLAGFFTRNIIADPRLKLALQIIAPSLPLVAMGAVFRGYFQGIAEMRVVAVSLLLEEIVHVGTTIGLLQVTLGRGPEILAAGFAAGSLLSELAGFGTYLVAFPLFHQTRRRPDVGFSLASLGSILHLSVPATMGRLLNSLSQLCQSVIIPTRLRIAGWTASQAAVAYGELTGMALNLLFMPSLFTLAMATTILPKVTTAVARSQPQQAKAAFLQVISWTALISLPLSAIFITLGEPICQLLFNSSSAGTLLSYLSWGGLLLYTQQIAGATLQGLGKPLLPLVISIVGTVISSLLLLFFTPLWQIEGVALALSIAWTTTGTLSLYLVQRQLPFFTQFLPFLLRTIFAALLCGITAHHFYWHCLAKSGLVLLSLLCAGIGAALVYLLVAAGAIRQQLASR